jgi:hypothetical protein
LKIITKLKQVDNYKEREKNLVVWALGIAKKKRADERGKEKPNNFFSSKKTFIYIYIYIYIF